MRCPSGVTRIRQRAVPGPLVAAGVSKRTPIAGDVVAIDLRRGDRRAPCRYRRRCPPSEAMPAIVLPADPPELSIAGPIIA